MIPCLFPTCFLRLLRASLSSRQGRNTALLLGCLLAAGLPGAARAAGRGAGANLGSGGAQFPALPRPFVPGAGRWNNSSLAQLNSQLRRGQLDAAAPRSYDIVPPAHPNLTPRGPVPGYQVVRLGRGRFNRLCFTSVVGGTKGLLELDTGANNTSLNAETFGSLRFNASYRLPAGVPRALNINGANVPFAQAPDFYVGDSNLGAVPVALLPKPYLTDPGTANQTARTYDGLFGGNILRHYGSIIDCGRLLLYLDVDPARKLDLGSAFVRQCWTRVPLADTGNHFLVPCVLNGRRFRLVVDTGSPFTVLDRKLLTGVGIEARDLPFRSGLIGKAAEPVGLVELDRLQIGGYTVAGVHMIASPQSLEAFAGRNDGAAEGPVVGLLGGDILAREQAVIDLGARALYLKHSAHDTAAPKVGGAARREVGSGAGG